MRGRSAAKNEADDVNCIGDVDVTSTVGIAKANRIWRRTATKNVINHIYGVGDVDRTRVVRVAAQAGGSRSKILLKSLIDLVPRGSAGAGRRLADGAGELKPCCRTVRGTAARNYLPFERFSDIGRCSIGRKLRNKDEREQGCCKDQEQYTGGSRHKSTSLKELSFSRNAV